MLLTVHNDSNYPITISEMTIFYDSSSPAGQELNVIYGDGILMWDKNSDEIKTGSPITISNFITNEPVEPWSSIALKLFFDKNIKMTGSENIMISFVENGCPLHDTNP